MTQSGIGGHRGAAVAEPVDEGHHRRHLGGEPSALAHARGRAVVLAVGIECTEGRNQRAQRGHGMGAPGKLSRYAQDAVGHGPLTPQLGGIGEQLVLAGEAAGVKKERRLLEGGGLGQGVDVDAPIGQDAAFPVDGRDAALAHRHVAQATAWLLRQPRRTHGPWLPPGK